MYIAYFVHQFVCQNCCNNVADRHLIDVDPDPDPTIHVDVAPDLLSICYYVADPNSTFYVDIGPDPISHVDIDPDPISHVDADPEPTVFSMLMLILILFSMLMNTTRIRVLSGTKACKSNI